MLNAATFLGDGMADRLQASLDDFNFHWPIRVRYSEVDAQGVVFYAHYATFADVGVTEYLRALGYDYIADARKTGKDFHLVRTVFEYLDSARVDEDIEVHIRISRIGRTSMTFEMLITRAGKSDPLTAGELVWVYTDQASHTSVPIPDHIIAKIRAHEGDKLDG